MLESEYRNAIMLGSAADIRKRVSCPNCLRSRDNGREVHLLDRWDALLVLEDLLPAAVEGPLPQGFRALTDDERASGVVVGRLYLLSGGARKRFRQSERNAVDMATVIGVECC